MRYSLPPKELSVWKGRIGEKAVQLYINDVLAPKLIQEGFDLVFYDMPPFPYIGLDPSQQESIPYVFRRLFLSRGVYLNADLLEKACNLALLLEVATDGILFKLNKTGRSIARKEALSRSKGGVKYFRDGHPAWFVDWRTLPKKAPIVSGEMEVVEIKTDKAFIMPHQMENYREVLKNGYLIRYFHVDIISFEENEFEICERVISSAKELKILRSNFSKRNKY